MDDGSAALLRGWVIDYACRHKMDAVLVAAASSSRRRGEDWTGTSAGLVPPIRVALAAVCTSWYCRSNPYRLPEHYPRLLQLLQLMQEGSEGNQASCCPCIRNPLQLLKDIRAKEETEGMCGVRYILEMESMLMAFVEGVQRRLPKPHIDRLLDGEVPGDQCSLAERDLLRLLGDYKCRPLPAHVLTRLLTSLDGGSFPDRSFPDGSREIPPGHGADERTVAGNTAGGKVAGGRNAGRNGNVARGNAGENGNDAGVNGTGNAGGNAGRIGNVPGGNAGANTARKVGALPRDEFSASPRRPPVTPPPELSQETTIMGSAISLELLLEQITASQFSIGNGAGGGGGGGGIGSVADGSAGRNAGENPARNVAALSRDDSPEDSASLGRHTVTPPPPATRPPALPTAPPTSPPPGSSQESTIMDSAISLELLLEQITASQFSIGNGAGGGGGGGDETDGGDGGGGGGVGGEANADAGDSDGHSDVANVDGGGSEAADGGEADGGGGDVGVNGDADAGDGDGHSDGANGDGGSEAAGGGEADGGGVNAGGGEAGGVGGGGSDGGADAGDGLGDGLSDGANVDGGNGDGGGEADGGGDSGGGASRTNNKPLPASSFDSPDLYSPVPITKPASYDLSPPQPTSTTTTTTTTTRPGISPNLPNSACVKTLSHADGNAAGNATGNNAGNAAGNAARNNAGDATRNKSGNATGNATGNIAGNAARNAAGNVAGSAAGNTAGSSVCRATRKEREFLAAGGRLGKRRRLEVPVVVVSDDDDVGDDGERATDEVVDDSMVQSLEETEEVDGRCVVHGTCFCRSTPHRVPVLVKVAHGVWLPTLLQHVWPHSGHNRPPEAPGLAESLP